MLCHLLSCNAFFKLFVRIYTSLHWFVITCNKHSQFFTIYLCILFLGQMSAIPLHWIDTRNLTLTLNITLTLTLMLNLTLKFKFGGVGWTLYFYFYDPRGKCGYAPTWNFKIQMAWICHLCYLLSSLLQVHHFTMATILLNDLTTITHKHGVDQLHAKLLIGQGQMGNAEPTSTCTLNIFVIIFFLRWIFFFMDIL